MALNFPLNPADGDTYEGYVYDATAGVWNSNPHQIASRFVTSATAPSSPSEGDGWFDTNTAKSYVYYDGVWVQLGALGTVDLNQIADVNVSSPANGESLVYDGTDWVNQNVSVDVYDVNTNSTGKFALPSGTTAERPVTPNAGDIRFNTETGKPEWYSSDLNDWFGFNELPTYNFDVEYLVIAGGGGAGSNAGGGGAGGYRSSVIGELSGGGNSAEPVINTATGNIYTVTVGSGGAGGASGGDNAGSQGTSSFFHTVEAVGGGGGAALGAAAPTSGGSGGGAGQGSGIGASGTINQGFKGGDSSATGPNYPGGGGGGAGSAGTNSTNTTVAGNGGSGVYSGITGSSVGRAGGGGGNALDAGGTAGTASEGGGIGVVNSSSPGNPGTANTGGGGGAGSSTDLAGSTRSGGGNGGSGLVIIKYPSSKTATPSAGLTSSTNIIGNYKITTFTAGTGTVTFS